MIPRRKEISAPALQHGGEFRTGDRTLRTRTATSYHVTTPENVHAYGNLNETEELGLTWLIEMELQQ